MPLQFRPARPEDVDAAVPLIYSAGPEAFEYGFTLGGHRVLDFLRYSFRDGRGFFGWRNHTVVTVGGEVVGIGAFYSGHHYNALTNGLFRQAARYYPLLQMPRVLRRGLQLKPLMPPPSRRMLYVANLGVRSDRRSQGIGAALLQAKQAEARKQGYAVYALDVSVQNPRGQALYERLGFQVTREQRFSGPTGVVPDTRRMEITLS